MQSRNTRIAGRGVVVAAAVCAAASGQELMLEKKGAISGEALGVALASLGDVDGDALPDWAAGAPHHTLDSEYGRVLVCKGKDGSVLYTLTGLQLGDDFGRGLANVGDVDGDLVNDLLVGAPQIGLGKSGFVKLFSGADGNLLRKVKGSDPYDNFGYYVLGVGDVDGDEVPDFCVGATGSDLGGTDTGALYAYSGATGAELWVAVGTVPDSHLGGGLAAIGDLDGDGIGEVLAGATGHSGPVADAGAVFVLSGATGSVHDVVHGDEQGEGYGRAVIGLGDLDSDGSEDWAVGAVEAGPSAGQVDVISGADSSILYTLLGESTSEYFGTALANVGDVDGDGFDELLASAMLDKNQGFYAGRASLHSGLSGDQIGRVLGNDLEYFGWDVEAPGDVDGDGRIDFLVGGVGTGQDGVIRLYAADWPMPPSSYCISKLNSAGCEPFMASTGTPTATGPDDFRVRAELVVNQGFGLFTWGTASKNAWFQGGTNCVAAPKARTPLGPTEGSPASVTDCSGVLSFDFTQAYMASKGLTPGTTFFVQAWYRDPDTQFYKIGLTNGLLVVLAP